MYVQTTSTDRCLRSSVEDIIEQLVGCGVGNCRQIGAVREAELASVERLIGKMRPDAETVRLPSVPSYRTCCTTRSNGVQFRTDCRIDNSSSSGGAVAHADILDLEIQMRCLEIFLPAPKMDPFFSNFLLSREHGTHP